MLLINLLTLDGCLCFVSEIFLYKYMTLFFFLLYRRVVRPWLGLKMIDLNEMIVAQLMEKDAALPNVTRGILVPMVCFFNGLLLKLIFILFGIFFFCFIGKGDYMS